MQPSPSSPSSSRTAIVVCAALALVPAYGAFQWFFCRVEPANDAVVVVIHKTGEDLPPEEIIATKGEKGIQLDVLGPGTRNWLNPFFYDWEEHPFVDVEPGQVGVLVRRFGAEPPPSAYEQGNFLVEKEPDARGVLYRGVVREVLKAGRHPVNPYAYEVRKFSQVRIATGFVGVVTNLVGEQPKSSNQYISQTGERGVQHETLGPGSYEVNPYERRVDPVDVRTKRFELAAEKTDEQHGVVAFYSSDGFEIDVHLTTTWQIDASRAAEVFSRTTSTGDSAKLEEEILQKVLTPAIRGYARIEGSKFPAIDYIGGASRQKFQKILLENLQRACQPFGVVVHEVLVNDIEPPKEIAEPIRDREIAKEELARNLNQIKQAQSEQSLARQSALVAQERARVEAETKRIQQTIAAQNAQDVALIEQEKLLLVAKTDLISAKAQASAIVARGEADASVIRAQNEAEAEPLKQSVAAFRSGSDFAAYMFSRKVAPAIHGVFADPAGPFGQMFSECLQQASQQTTTAPKAGER